MEIDKQYLYDMYNATSTDDGSGNDEIESYENWLERQLISRIKTINKLENNKLFFCQHKLVLDCKEQCFKCKNLTE
jgi:hypothetical protein